MLAPGGGCSEIVVGRSKLKPSKRKQRRPTFPNTYVSYLDKSEPQTLYFKDLSTRNDFLLENQTTRLALFKLYETIPTKTHQFAFFSG